METVSAIGQQSSYASWKTHPLAHNAVIKGLKALLTQAFKEGKKPDLIVCHGSSGIFAVAPLVSWLGARGVAVFHARKPGEVAHGAQFEGPRLERTREEGPFEAWMIDDMVATGDTVRRVRDLCDNYNTRLTTVICYGDTTPNAVSSLRVVGRNFTREVLE